MKKPIAEYLKESNRVKERRKINYELKKYQGFLSKEMYEYLRSLLNLEMSVVSDKRKLRDKELLSTLDIYDFIMEYNLKYRTLQLLKHTDCVVGQIDMDNYHSGTGVFFEYQNESFPVYAFGKSRKWSNQYVEIHKLLSDKEFLLDELDYLDRIINESDDISDLIYLRQLLVLKDASLETDPFATSLQLYDTIMNDFHLKREDFGEELMDFCMGCNVQTKKELELPGLELVHIEDNDVVEYIKK